MINKIVKPCFVEVEGRNYPAYARIKFDGKRLSITGVVGPMRNGNCKGGCGQCVDSIRNGTPATGWDVDLLRGFCHVWDRWHLNDMRPYCQHQKELGWDKLAEKNVTVDRSFGKSEQLLGWIRPTEHPDGLLGKACPICGYKYGSDWLTEEVPQYVIEFLKGLPDSNTKPAWV